MSQGFIVGSGGSQGKGPVKKGTIGIYYPTGATCTVSNGSKIYTALDTSGAAAFIVDPGEWTVTAVSGSDTASKSISVTDGGFASVELSFWQGDLYYNGDEYTEITGGWIDVYTRGGVTKNADSITVLGGANYTCRGVTTAEKIDIAGFSKLNITMKTVTGGDTGASFLALVDADNTGSIRKDNGYGGDMISPVVSVLTNSQTTFSVDISSLAESNKTEYYVVYYVAGTSGVERKREFTHIWLE